jgi:putative transposase
LAQQFGASRFVYNYFLRQRIDYYAAHRGEKKPGLTYHDTARLLTELKHQPETAWLKDANSQALQAALRNLDTAYNNFFNKRTEFPKFKSKRDKQSFHVPQHFALDREHSRLILPKLTPIKIVLHRPLEGEIKSITISRAPTGRHFAVILCEAEITPKPKKTGRIIGVDLGLKSFAVTSDGEKVDPPQHLRKAGAKLAILQRRMARKQRGSKNREKTQLKVARLHEKVANQRADFLHKLSRHLIDESQAIYVEDLNVKGMLANRHLAKSISDSSWSEFVRQLDYKGTWYGCQVRTIDRFFPSSKRHALCGYIYQDLRLSEREWTCPECGQVVDRDANAAQNILLFGQLTHCKIISRRAGTVLTSTPGETAARKGGHGTRKPPASGW